MRIRKTSWIPEGEGFLNGPSVTQPDTVDPMYNFSHACDSEMPSKCTIVPLSEFWIISRLEEGEQAIVLNLVVELADSGQHF
jgi:hypothetical protein